MSADFRTLLLDQLLSRPGQWSEDEPHAAVLIALTDEAEPQVVLVKRALHLRLHAGEMAFPGGMRESDDLTPWDTALREAQEEIALAPDRVRPLGNLAPLRTRTGIQVHPCIALIPPDPEFTVDRTELDRVMQGPLAFFAEQDALQLDRMEYRDTLVYVPRYDWRGESVWGVTGALLALLVNITHNAGLDLRRNWNTT